MNKTTLSRKLFIRIAPTILATILLIGAFAFHSADKEINTIYDAQLTNDANVLWMLISDKIETLKTDVPRKVEDLDDLVASNPLKLQDYDLESASEYADSRMFRIWKDGKLLLYSDTALPPSVQKSRNGFSTIVNGKDEWRVYTLPVPKTPITIEVGEKIDLRDALVANILLDLALPLLLLIPVVEVLIWLGIRYGLGAIHGLVAHIRERSPGDLSHVNISMLPKDLAPLGKSLNQLFTKLEHSFTIEKRFTDHAAHQLRTPLATLKLQLQMLANTKEEKDKQALLKELMQSNERATKLVNMLLTSARLNHQTVKLEPINLYITTANVMADLGLLAKEKNIELSLEGEESATVPADDLLLKLMLNNVIENAIKYTPQQGRVAVRITKNNSHWKCTVTDNGPGIPEGEQNMVFERFYRVSTPEVEGSGLGLTIAAEIVRHFDGTIALKTPENGTGLHVEMLLPKA